MVIVIISTIRTSKVVFVNCMLVINAVVRLSYSDNENNFRYHSFNDSQSQRLPGSTNDMLSQQTIATTHDSHCLVHETLEIGRSLELTLLFTTNFVLLSESIACANNTPGYFYGVCNFTLDKAKCEANWLLLPFTSLYYYIVTQSIIMIVSRL